ncbi:hypothetical protein L9G16_24035, partial [Shewanella sp. A25]|nr:hypothetical protein [Shewanella shenzhenensis]
AVCGDGAVWGAGPGAAARRRVRGGGRAPYPAVHLYGDDGSRPRAAVVRDCGVRGRGTLRALQQHRAEGCAPHRVDDG